jgi:CDP-6-deoxy-D-xylo-4-hexulose-3-dehydrase
MDEFLQNSNLDRSEDAKILRSKILELVKEYSEISHPKKSFEEVKSNIPVAGKVYDFSDLQMLVSSSLDFWLTSGRFNDEFEKQLSKFLGLNFAITTNSGSSANLLALASLTSHMHGDRALNPGDEVITAAAGFPTTVNPIIQYGLTPVFVDVEIPTYSVSPKSIEDAINDKTKAIMIAHTLGNPFDAEAISKIAKENNLWLIEDCCDALGSTINQKSVGTFGDIGTLSFYPAHHITMGEGGAVFTNNPTLKRIIESFRDWGRDCFCPTGKNNTCGKRFCWQLGELPFGYDHKFTYSHVGYNLKISDMQAAVGLSQLQKLSSFIETRKKNFTWLHKRLQTVKEFFILPEATQNSQPSWFGFPLTIQENAHFHKNELTQFLSENGVDTRPIFAGNMTKQPYFQNLKYRKNEELENTDLVMNNSFWIGVYPGLDEKMLEYTVKTIEKFVFKHK